MSVASFRRTQMLTWTLKVCFGCLLSRRPNEDMMQKLCRSESEHEKHWFRPSLALNTERARARGETSAREHTTRPLMF